MKDNFSTHSNLYKQFRPEYPAELFDWIFQQVSNFDTAWDCGTGNGQIAKVLATKFKNVFATDISEQQLLNAEKLPNIKYSKQAAELTNLPDYSFDLITVGQAIHWFNFSKFYEEVNRISRNNALIAVVGYGTHLINPEIDTIIDKLYSDILGGFWDKERKYIEENYLTIPFPFKEIKCPNFFSQYSWDLPHLIGYLETWSAVKHYQKEKNLNPVLLIKKELQAIWKEGEMKQVIFPTITRIGRIG
jgi:ubiquinone/menaquinone biosynthesis C-methylase UbiE